MHQGACGTLGGGGDAGGSAPRRGGGTCSRPRRGRSGQERAIALIPRPQPEGQGSSYLPGAARRLLPRTTCALPTLVPHSGPNPGLSGVLPVRVPPGITPHKAVREYSFPRALWKGLGCGCLPLAPAGSSPPPPPQLAHPPQPRPAPGRLGHQGTRAYRGALRTTAARGAPLPASLSSVPSSKTHLPWGGPAAAHPPGTPGSRGAPALHSPPRGWDIFKAAAACGGESEGQELILEQLSTMWLIK